MNSEAECYVLGGVLAKPESYWTIADRIRAEHFQHTDHRLIWQTITSLVRRGEPADAVTVGDACPMIAHLALDLATASFSVARLGAYADLVLDHALARDLRAAGARVAKLDGTGRENLAEAQTLLGALVQTIAGPGRPIADVVDERVATMQAQRTREADLLGISTGLTKLDRLTAGMQAAQLIIVAGRPSMGKSALALWLALHAAQHDAPAHIISLEMSAADCVARMQAMLSRVPLHHIRDARQLTADEWEDVHRADAELRALPITFDDAVFDLTAIIARIRQVHAITHSAVVVIDYLSYIKPPRAENQALALQEITRELKRLAKELSIAVVLVSQLNRALEVRENKRPMLSDLRESGAIEQDADVVLMLYRDGYYKANSIDQGYAELLLRKQRNGPTGMVPLLADLSIQRFEQADGLPSDAARLTHTPRHFDGSPAPRRAVGFDGKMAAAGEQP